VTLNVENFPKALRVRARRLAAARGMHLKGAVIQALQRWCIEEEVHQQVNVRVPPQRDNRAR
jgi:hypothetical protein